MALEPPSGGRSNRGFLKLVAWISDLRPAIGLLLLIAMASSIGTLIPQQEPSDRYRTALRQPCRGLG